LSVLNELIEAFNSGSLDFETSFKYAKICSKFLQKAEMEEQGRRIIINILDNWEKIDKNTCEVWTDLVESAGFYPYLEKEKGKLNLRSTPAEIRKEFHKSKFLKEYFHEEQLVIREILKSEKNVIVSAPTSFGKSLLIDEVVASRKYKNIVVVIPTLALIDETRRRLQKYREYYKLIVRTTQRPSTLRGNLFLLTAERVMEYSGLPSIDFFVIDEFYKLSAKRDEERSDVLNNAFNLLLTEHHAKFYLLGPNIDEISDGFAEKHNAKFYRTDYSLVDNREINMYSEEFGEKGRKRKNKEKALFKLLLSLQNEQTIIYCKSPALVRDLSRRFCNFLKKREFVSKEKLSIIEWLNENVDPKWSLIDCLNYGIGIHDGALSKHITISIIDYFNHNKLQYLFCTTTIIEGVNTSAKNVVYFSKTKGRNKPIDYFDYCNIKGRSGRMMVHYVGRIFNLNKPPEKEIISVDIPIFDQDPISDEVLININEEDVKNKETEQYNKLEKIPPDQRAIFKKNGVSIWGQAKILSIITENYKNEKGVLVWSGYPSYFQLKYVLQLAWDNLLKSSESRWPMTRDRLPVVVHQYQRHKSISVLVENIFEYMKEDPTNRKKNEIEIYDIAIREAFQMLRRWFHYKIPKWLNVMNSLQKYVYESKGLPFGDYTYYSTQLESDFVRENLATLIEYGIPRSAIMKFENRISEELDESQVLDEIKNNNIVETSNLLEYEKEKIRENW